MKFWKWACAAALVIAGVLVVLGKDDMIRIRQMHRM